LFYAFRIEPASLRLSRYDVESPAPLKGLKIAVIADLHAGSPFIDEAKIDRVVALTNAARPDLIVLTGDYVVGVPRRYGGRRIGIETITAHLGELRAPLGVYAVLGNHERWAGVGNDRVIAAFGAVHIAVLQNGNVRIGPLYLAGIGDDHTRQSDPVRALSGVPPAAPAICVTHSPDIFPRLPGTCALTLAGHSHGGQVRLPLLGRPVLPLRTGPRYAAGLVREGGKTLFVSTGIGTSGLTVRLGVPPEISLLRLL
jgi:predicted MPP superfamily phosphohydrolase